MKYNVKLFAILAIFCVICSACAVSAADNISDDSGDLYLGEGPNVHDGAIIPPDNTHSEDQQHAAGGIEEHDGVPYHADGTDPTGNATGHAAGADTTGNATGHAAGANATGNSTNATATNKLPATGNPVLVLMAVGALLGGYAVIRKK